MSNVMIRQLQEQDLLNGFMISLDSLYKTSNMAEHAAKEIFRKITADSNHTIIVADIDGLVVGCATILVEQKFIHDGAKAAHIEDVSVSGRYQGMGIGKKIISYALSYAKSRGCYKTVLYCADEVRPFYEKQGFKCHTNALRFDH